MDSVDFDNVKAEKPNAMGRHNRLQSIAKLFRLVEACLVVVFLSWTFTRLPFAVKISGEFLRKVAWFMASPLFVFLLCNAIIAALIAKSGKFFSENIDANNADAELYEEFIKSSENRTKPLSEDAPLSTEDEIVYKDKEMIISEANAISRTCENDTDADVDLFKYSDSEFVSDNPKLDWRCKSEKLEKEKPEREEVRLRRSETEKFMKSEDWGEKTAADGLYPEDELSNEEFQRTIEEFIAKQLMYRRQESLAVVLHNQA